MHRIQITLIFVILLMLLGCSSGQSPVTPGSSVDQVSQNSVNNSNRTIWGYWTIRIENEAVEIVPDRAIMNHFNVVRLLEVDPCTDCLTIENLQFPTPNEITANFRIQHPFPGLVRFTGFDVRGILITGSDYTFPVSWRSVNLGDDFPRLLNADGYTQLFNPTEYPEGVTEFPALAYITGNKSMGGDYTATLNPFISYMDDEPRRMFFPGSAETHFVHLYRPEGPLEFGYAVDASWVPVDDVIDPETDFPPEANAFEAYDIEIMGGNNFQLTTGTPEEIFIEVWDHQGLDTISSVTVEAPDIFTVEIPLEFLSETGEDSWLFSGLVSNELETEVGEYPMLVRVRDTWDDGNLGVVDAWQIGEVTVNEAPETGWVRTWGENMADVGSKLVLDEDENIYVTGTRRVSDIQSGHITKFNKSGDLLWDKTWIVNGTVENSGYGGTGVFEIKYDDAGSIYLVGHFQNSADLDPGPGIATVTSNGGSDVFLSMFNTDGDFQWALTFGGSEHEGAFGLSLDEAGSIYYAGLFSGSADFDPGAGSDVHTSNGSQDVFLTKLDSTGVFQWCKTWGGPGLETSHTGNAVDILNNVYVTSSFSGTVDFDPGSGIDEHTAQGSYDVFISKFNSNGEFLWVRSWGGVEHDNCTRVTTTGLGELYLTGFFTSSSDFDPGPGEDFHTSNGGWDIYLAKYNLEGEFLWAHTWGGTDSENLDDASDSVAIDSFGDVFVTGTFTGTNVDFDPGPGTDIRNSNGVRDAFLSKFDGITGDFLWAQTLGSTGYDVGWGVAIPDSDNIYLSGTFWNSVNFAPDDGLCDNSPDIHESNGSYDGFLIKFLPDGCW